MESMGPGPPLARKEKLLCREVPDGLMVYDLDRREAHSLNQAAALVWRRCDGKTSVPEIAEQLHTELNLPQDEELVWLALGRLDRAQLLDGPLTESDPVRTSRRAVIRKLGLAGGLAALLPLVDSLTAPPAMAADSAGGGPCAAADCSVCGDTGGGPKLCCSGPSNTVVCVSHNSANCASCP